MLNRLIAAAIVVGFAPCGDREVSAQVKQIPEQQIKSFVEPFVDAKVVNSVSVGVVLGDQTWFGNFGTLSAEHDQKPNEKTIYEIGSVTKTFTGVLLAHAVASGELRLDQSIGSVWPELKESNPKVAESVLLRHLSTHSSGLPRIPSDLASRSTNPYADYDRKKLAAFMGRVKPVRAPDEGGEYSNLAVGLLGELLSISGDSDYETMVKEVICKPLQMNDTTIKLTDEQKTRLAPPHNVSLKADHSWDFQSIAAAGAIRSTTSDMIKFVQAHLHPEKEMKDTIELAWKEHARPKGYPFAMGLGWHIARDGSTRWHNGQTGGYHSMVMINRSLDAGVVVLCNTASAKVDGIGESIVQMLAGVDVKPPEFDLEVEVEPKKVARLAGVYELAPNFSLTIRADQSRLFVQATGQPELEVFPSSETRWFYKVVAASLVFKISDDGKCEAVTLHQNGLELPGKRTAKD